MAGACGPSQFRVLVEVEVVEGELVEVELGVAPNRNATRARLTYR